MIVELDIRGAMVIRAETAVESFALGHWFRLWQTHETTLRVETPNDVPFVKCSSQGEPDVR